MPRDSSGNFSRSNGSFSGTNTWVNTAASDPTIRSARHDTHDNDVGDEITNSLDRDGKGGMRANLEMGGFRVVNVGAPTADTDAIRRGDSFQLTAQDSSDSSNVNFVGIPAWAKEIVVLPYGVRTNGTSNHAIRIGASSLVTTGYLGSCGNIGASSVSSAAYSGSGFQLENGRGANTNSSGAFTLYLQDEANNNWVCEGSWGFENAVQKSWSVGSLQLGAGNTLQRVTLYNGGSVYTGGLVKILIKG